ncbi:hypothetical protein PENTCL1PPCAC_20991 [Pristionchus entomophagus]|uniref:Cuti-1 n=1 Tax=Pristionchus entomophagus TaxID=358040 RepID=A0AAV5TX16_9BILA|nr:hypothetical protein PENTCL1PPCAC_20991 [Pristionchus entomophagus]
MGHDDLSKAEVLPPNFIYSTEDKFYYGPATCEYLHYRSAAVLGAIIEFLLMGAGTVIAYYLYSSLESLEYFVVWSMAVFFAMSTAMSLLMLYGLFTENPALIKPKIVIQEIEIASLIGLATFAVIAMCIGLDATNYLFGFVLNVDLMEEDFGPIWPFNISILAFMAAALGVWIRILTIGAQDYLLDKEFFSQPNHMNVALEEKNRDD